MHKFRRDRTGLHPQGEKTDTNTLKNMHAEPAKKCTEKNKKHENVPDKS